MAAEQPNPSPEASPASTDVLPLKQAFTTLRSAAAPSQAAILVALGAELAGARVEADVGESDSAHVHADSLGDPETSAGTESAVDSLAGPAMPEVGLLSRRGDAPAVPPATSRGLGIPALRPERRLVPREAAQERLFDELAAWSTPPVDAPPERVDDLEVYADLAERLDARPGPTRANDLIEACLSHPRRLTRVAAATAHLLRGQELTVDLVAPLVDGTRSGHAMTRALAGQALARFAPSHARLADLVAPGRPRRPGDATHSSHLLHGTFARAHAWWQAGGDFHEHLRTGPRPDVYGAPDRFEWSGGYSDEARRIGAMELVAWAAARHRGDDDWFGHSHGGNVLLLATRHGFGARQVLLLSTPAMKRYVPAFDAVASIKAIRVWFDPVVLVAGGAQSFGDARIEERVIPGVDHGATHEPGVWRRHGLDAFVGPAR